VRHSARIALAGGEDARVKTASSSSDRFLRTVVTARIHGFSDVARERALERVGDGDASTQGASYRGVDRMRARAGVGAGAGAGRGTRARAIAIQSARARTD